VSILTAARGFILFVPGPTQKHKICQVILLLLIKAHDEVIKLYFGRFSVELKDLESPYPLPFTLAELKQEYDDCYKFGFIMGCGHAQVTTIRS